MDSDSNASDSASAAGDDSDSDVASSPNETDRSSEELREEDDDELEEGEFRRGEEEKEEAEEDDDEEVDIINASDQGTPAEGGMKEDNINVDQETLAEMEVEGEKDVSMKESEFGSGDSVEEQSSESDEERTEVRFFHYLLPNFPSLFTKRIDDPRTIRPRILMEKRLHKSDVDENRNRLSIPAKKMKEKFLLPAEEERLYADREMKVELIEPNGGSTSSMTLREWRIGDRRPPSYVFTGEWNQVVARNSHVLTRGARVRLWYFRVQGGRRLWFALQVLEEDCEEAEKEQSEKWWGQIIFAP